MKLKHLLACVTFLLCSIVSFSQTYETRNRVEIPSDRIILKSVKVKDCNDTIPAGHVVKKEYTKKNGEVTYTVTKTDTLQTPGVYKVEKTITKELTDMDGYANITGDEKDKSILHVNYWLNDFSELNSNTRVKVRTKKLDCKGDYISKDTTYRLRSDTTFNLWKVEVGLDTTTDWFKHSGLVMEVFKKNDSTTIDYYLVDRYEKDADYTIKLENREFVSFRKLGIEYGPITIPFKLRFGYTKDKIEVDEEFSADLNVGFFGGIKLGKYRFRYEKPTLKELANLSVTVGGFISLSTAALDSVSTRAGKDPFTKDEKATIGVLSPGVGLMFAIYNFQFGAFLGVDVGFGRDAKNWNFNNRPWLGFGISYNLTGFWKK